MQPKDDKHKFGYNFEKPSREMACHCEAPKLHNNGVAACTKCGGSWRVSSLPPLIVELRLVAANTCNLKTTSR
jgi:hypothetical protein